MRIRVDPLVSVVRCYKFDIDPTLPLYKMKERYYKSFPITFLDSGVVRVSAVVEAPTIREKIQLQRYLRELGYHSVEWRHGDKEELFKL
jgi:hypothetical protein